MMEMEAQNLLGKGLLFLSRGFHLAQDLVHGSQDTLARLQGSTGWYRGKWDGNGQTHE